MSFRDRPEYKDWRASVFELFGRQCILCGHCRNLTAHHVRPVNLYPELAFDPKNGVPLCGNCHSDVNSSEMEYVDEFQCRQNAILAGAQLQFDGFTETDDDLKRQVVENPTDPERIETWFATTSNSQEVVDFYNANRQRFPKTAGIYLHLAFHLQALKRHPDAIKVANAALERAELDGILKELIGEISTVMSISLRKLGRDSEAVSFLRDQVRQFSDEPMIHFSLANALWPRVQHFPVRKQDPISDECVTHALHAAQLKPDNCIYVRTAITAAVASDRWFVAIRLAHRFFDSDPSDEESTAEVLRAFFPGCFQRSDRDFAKYCQKLTSELANPASKAKLAHCMWLVHRRRSASELAKDCLADDPNNLLAHEVLRQVQGV